MDNMKLEIGDIVYFARDPYGVQINYYIGYVIKSNVDKFSIKWIKSNQIIEYPHTMYLGAWTIQKF